jgi:catechol 2,3-dioxygenase-like lactoylglutathione lyase family enzyme
LRNAFDRDGTGGHVMRLCRAIVALLALHVTAHGADADDASAKLDSNGNHIVEEAEAQAGGRKLFAARDKNGDGLLQAR